MIAGKTIHNPIMILLAAFLIGGGIYLNYISAQAFLLSIAKPVYIIYLMAVGGAAFGLFLKFNHFGRKKFAIDAFKSTLFYIAVLALLAFGPLPHFALALCWVGISIFAIMFFKWVIISLAIRHLNPGLLQTYFVYIYVAIVTGALTAISMQRYLLTEITPAYLISTIIVIFTALSLLLFVVFCPNKNLEISIGKEEAVKSNHFNMVGFKGFSLIFYIIIFFYGAFEFIENYLARLYFREVLMTFERINETLGTIFMISSACLAILSPILGKLIRTYQPSPIILYALYAIVPAGMAVNCLINPSIASFMALEVSLFLMQDSLFMPALQMMMTSFPPKEREHLFMVDTIGYLVYPNIILAIIFTFTAQEHSLADISPLLLLFIGCAILICTFLVYFRYRLIKLFYTNVGSNNKSVSVLSAQGLSYLKPLNYTSRMIKILKRSPKKLLRKTIIMGLGRCNRIKGIEAIIAEFDSDSEEIQNTVIAALCRSKKLLGVEFIIEVLLGMHPVKSMNVRMNAAAALAEIFGHQALPILLVGLHDKDERVQANVLDILSLFKDEALIHEIEPHLTSKTSRVKANALMAIFPYPKMHEAYNKVVKKMLAGKPNEVASCLYAIGRMKDKTHLTKILQIAKSKRASNPMVKRCLAWALTHLEHPKGYSLFEALFSKKYVKEKHEDFLHLYLQLDKEHRFQILEDILLLHPDNAKLHKNIYQHLKNSHFDFHDEIDFIFSFDVVHFHHQK